ncbi:MAG: hypothetical protein EOO10_07350 [Chitinophagaceae bacterium]|nr:MAG: hypothetical protein EOO10_07350 [Chitinophagaceae bacterium]
MKPSFLFFFLTLCFVSFSQKATVKNLLTQVPTGKPREQKQIMFLGCSHFGQEGMYKGNPAADLFTAEKQKEIAAINGQLAAFKPDVILIEREPEEQSQVDSLYTAYRSGKLAFTDLSYGRAEQYQFGFALAEKLNHQRVFGADYYEAVSNRMMTTGANREAFQQGLDSFSAFGRKAEAGFKSGSFSLKDFLLLLNAPTVLNWTYRVLFVTPLQVKNGAFTSPPATYVDTAYVNKKYIGAEFVSIFMERELKIYANIVNITAQQKAARVLVIMGHRHAAALPKLFQNDPAYKVVSVEKYLK